MNCGAGVSLDLTGPMSISYRGKFGTQPQNSVFIVVKDAGTYRYGIYFDNSSKLLSFYLRLTINGVKTVVATTGPKPRDGAWHHTVGTFDGRYLRIYIDGQYYNITDAGSADTITTGAGQPLLVSTWSGGYINHYMSELQIHNRQLSDDEILYNYFHPNNPKRQGLVLNLTQESIYGSQWNDTSGNANNGTYVNGALPMRNNLVTQR